MKFFIILLAALALVSACSDGGLNEVEVSGGVDVNSNFERTEIRQIAGILYIRTTDSLNPYCLAIDTSTDYGTTWLELPDADALRLTTYTADELANCNR